MVALLLLVTLALFVAGFLFGLIGLPAIGGALWVAALVPAFLAWLGLATTGSFTDFPE